jgi:hypothetical protein
VMLAAKLGAMDPAAGALMMIEEEVAVALNVPAIKPAATGTTVVMDETAAPKVAVIDELGKVTAKISWST